MRPWLEKTFGVKLPDSFLPTATAANCQPPPTAPKPHRPSLVDRH